MKKLAIALLALLLIPLAGYSVEIKGGVRQDVEIKDIQIAAFSNVPSKIDVKGYIKIDTYHDDNMVARLLKQNRIEGRFLNFFSTGHYSVQRIGFPEILVYNKRGFLIRINQIFAAPGGFPYRVSSYSARSGKLKEVYYSKSAGIDYLFKPNQKFKGYCFYSRCYDAKGNYQYSRQYQTEWGY